MGGRARGAPEGAQRAPSGVPPTPQAQAPALAATGAPAADGTGAWAPHGPREHARARGAVPREYVAREPRAPGGAACTRAPTYDLILERL
jgi:hypothetical protein